MEGLIQDGTIQSRPQSLNFFLTAATGKRLVDDCLSKLRSVDQSASSFERANKAIGGNRKEAPSEAQAQHAGGLLDSLFGEGWRERL